LITGVNGGGTTSKTHCPWVDPKDYKGAKSMSTGSPAKTPRSASALSGLIFQVQRPGDDRPLQFPAKILNLSGGVVTLEVKKPWISLQWDTLKGQRGGLLLLPAGTEEVTEIRGTVAWTRQTAQGADNLSLGLELASPSVASHKQLIKHIPHTSDDIKGLWDRWEEARQSSAASRAVSTKIGYTAVVLLAAGLALQLAEPQGYKLVGWGLWFLGSLGVAGQTLHYWRSRKAAR
jgi:hypothetical protein